MKAVLNMICPKCHGTGKISFSYTVRYKVGSICDYEGCVEGIVHCCDGIQAQPVDGVEPNEKTNDYG